MQLDVIGDTHGHAEALRMLLRKLGYLERDGAWRHAGGRRAVFLGDLVDRGPDQFATIDIARRMIEADTALIVMGNHEYNAIAFATRDPSTPGEHFRPRRGNNVRHHAAFLDAVGGPDSDLHRELIAFLETMPLWLDLDGVRIVHACWSGAAMDALRPRLDAAGRLTGPALTAVLTPTTPAHAACEIILKGPEMTLPPGVWYRDAQGSKRRRTRTRWWDAAATTIRSACAETAIADQLPEDPVPPECIIPLDETKPILFGHYWMDGEPFLLHPKRTCLDFSIAKGGVLCAYRFDGEPDLDPTRLVWMR